MSAVPPALARQAGIMIVTMAVAAEARRARREAAWRERVDGALTAICAALGVEPAAACARVREEVDGMREAMKRLGGMGVEVRS